ncbi:MAG: hypothetical protein CM1200mP41_18930 [Gammaproteobacteria bacterium]|nr:MAG: hypothetical protein CM1200mP41_18930 [Gammaproteobacteria bacterium]
MGYSKAGLGAGNATPIVQIIEPVSPTHYTSRYGGNHCHSLRFVSRIACRHASRHSTRSLGYVFYLSLISVPDFLVATFLVLVFSVYLGWLPPLPI